MKSKCGWKGEVFYPCINHMTSYSDKTNTHMLMSKGYYIYLDARPNFCPFCGADIIKPEPEEPIIKKSGKTWVARYYEVDYLSMHTELVSIDGTINAKVELFLRQIKQGIWIPFDDKTEITDEIAKLRPMVVTGKYGICLEKLWGVDEKECLTETIEECSLHWTNRVVVYLATVDNLNQ